jgi:hypothetical protein
MRTAIAAGLVLAVLGVLGVAAGRGADVAFGQGSAPGGGMNGMGMMGGMGMMFVASWPRCEFRASTQTAPPLRPETSLGLASGAVSETG